MRTTKRHTIHPLGRELSGLLTVRLFVPTLALIVLATCAAGYLWDRALGTRQRQLAGSLAHTVWSYTDDASRVLHSLALITDAQGTERAMPAIEAAWKRYGSFDTIYRLSAQGRIVALAPRDPRYLHLDHSAQPYFRNTLREGRLTFTAPFASIRTGKPTTYMAIPLADGGVLAAELNLGALQEAIESARLDDVRGRVFVTDQSGMLLAHPDASRVAQQMNVGHLTVVRRGLKEAVSLHYNGGDGWYRASATPVPDRGWVVVVEIPLLGVVMPFLSAAVPAMALLLVAWGLLIWTFRRRFERLVITPLEDLGATARRVASGDLRQTAPEHREDEIGALVRAFNAMTGELRRRIEMENLLASLSRRFITTGGEETGRAVQHALEELGRFTGTDGCALYLFSPDRTLLHSTHAWTAQGIDLAQHMPLDLAVERFGWLHGRLAARETVHVPDVDALPPEARAEQDEFRRMSLRSVLCVPMLRTRSLQGFLAFCAITATRSWSEEDVRLLRLVAEIIGNALEHGRQEEALAHEADIHATMAEISRVLISAASMGAITSLILDHAKRLTASPDGFAGFIAPGTKDLVRPTPAGATAEEAARLFEGVNGLWRRVHATRAPLMTNAPRADFADEIDGADAGRVRRFLCVPSLMGEKLLGQIAVANARRDYTRRDLALVERLAALYALALQRTMAEEELAAQGRRLEQLVARRTQALAQKAEELEQANQQLRELDAMKSSFLSSVSHELRTPLTSVRGFAKLITRDMAQHVLPGLAPTQQLRARRVMDNVEIIEAESMRLTRLINDVLDLSKIEAGKMNWEDRPTQIAAVIDKACRAVSMQVHQRPELVLERSIQESLPDLVVDPDRLEQVLINLLDNALKFTDKGFVRIEARQVDTALRVAVADSGMGIDPEDLDRIFDKFHQARRADTLDHKPKGTGLGLAICGQIVSHYGGRIWAESKGEGGATFLFELPVSGD